MGEAKKAKDTASGDLETLVNIGPKLAAALREAGIADADALIEVGPVAAWHAIHPTFECINSLQNLAGAVRGIRVHDLDPDTRAELREAFRQA